MYFPRLYKLIKDDVDGVYSEEIISYVDDFLGSLEVGSIFSEEYFNSGIRNILKTSKIADHLISLGLIREEIEEINTQDADDDNSSDRYFELIIAPQKNIDKKYLDYKKSKRYIDSFSIIYEKSKLQKSGALVLIDLKGYSKNINKSETNAMIILLTGWLKELITNELAPYFLDRYSGIEIKQNGDGWFLYFLKEREAYSFLKNIMQKCNEEGKIKDAFKSLGNTLKGYIHHAKEIESIYKVDTLHFDMEGRDVILIHMLEKPIESRLYDDHIIPITSNFIAITESVYDYLNTEEQKSFRELQGVDMVGKAAIDREGNSKIYNSSFKIYYQVTS